MTEIFKRRAYTYYMQEESDGYCGLYVWYDDGKKQTTSKVQIEGNNDFVVKSKNISYVGKVIRAYVKEFYYGDPNLSGHLVFKMN